MDNKIKKYLIKAIAIIVFGLVIFNNSFAVSLANIPHLYLAGFGGYDDWTALGKADVLAPVFLRNDRMVYIYGQGRYGYDKASWANNTWTGSFGLGYRQMHMLFNYPSILGVYVFGDYSRTNTGNNVMVISPGIESLGFNWDFRINGYIPIGKKSWKTEGWADKFGNYDYVQYKGHDEYDAWFIYHEETGIGADAEVGRNILFFRGMLLKGYLAGFAYDMDHNKNLYGASARLSLHATSYLEISVADTYDTYKHNVVMGGIRVSLNNLFDRYNIKQVDSVENLQTRLFDPIDRNLASIGSGSTVPIVGGPKHGKPEVIPYTPPNSDPHINPPPPNPWNNHHTPEKDNVWFFTGISGSSLSNTTPDGTYEHPYTKAYFSQQILDDINKFSSEEGKNYADLYFNPGTYYTEVNTALNVCGGQKIEGRMGDNKGYQEPATGDNRPLIIGSLNLSAGNNTISDIKMENNAGLFDQGIYANNATDTTISDVEIGTPSGETTSGGGTAYSMAINMNKSSATISNAILYGSTYGINLNASHVVANNAAIGGAFGIDMATSNVTLNSSTVTGNTGVVMSASDITLNSSVITGDGAGGASGVYMINGGSLTATSSTIKGISNGTGYGINADGKAEIIQLNHTGVVGQGSAGVGYGILVGNQTYSNTTSSSVANNTVTISNGSSVTASGVAGYGLLVGYYNSNNTMGSTAANISSNHVSITSSTVTGTANNSGGDGVGLLIGVDHWVAAQGIIVNGNAVGITNSTLVGTANHGDGNGYGVLIGANDGGYVSGDPTIEINNNAIQITGSTTQISGSGVDGGAPTSWGVDNGFGLLLGVNHLYSVTKEFFVEIQGNNLLITAGAHISGSGHATIPSPYHVDYGIGNGFGVLVGSNFIESAVDSFLYKINGSSNTINITGGSVITASGYTSTPGKSDESSGYANGDGFLFGINGFKMGRLYTIPTIIGTSTNVNISNSTFNIASTCGEGWGIYIEQGNGLPRILTVSGDVFNRTDGGHSGGKIHWHENNVDPWSFP